mgnify:CR=1 FL=1
MKKSTFYFIASIILLCSGVLVMPLIFKMAITPILGILLIITGSKFAKKGREFYNLEHGNSPETVFILSKKQKIFRYAAQGFILLSTVLLIIWNLYR